ncbi:hypothetical protein KDX38_22490 [Pseudomonas sp. CDFA 602]|uniref:hypothetical protein n=1 Tax=Pseudomonas californiensis TaxID=2829823 RepID=UPI001E459B6C|nr:hypothetical protein [Pseudomonas californiensis]MCD5996367.1 hypothetical protein [Pseudomonas californiensis]MCD6001966.1 hypothetical protein [Pseudomonas californiensis]
MKASPFLSVGLSAVCLTILAFNSQANAAPVEYKGRDVFHFESGSGCPGTSGQSDHDCNRIALDVSDAHATLDAQAHVIVIGAEGSHDSKAVLAEVLLHGSGIAADGTRVPLSLQVLLRRSGKQWKSDAYVHTPVRGKFKDVMLDPYQIKVQEGASERVLISAEQARDILAQPSITAQVASYFVAVRPSDEQNPAADDITVALGVGKVSKSLMRARFTSEQPKTAELGEVMKNGTWNLNLQALTGQIPVWAVQRQLFVFGLEDSPLLKDVRQRGLNKLDTLELGAVNGNGYLRYSGREQSFPQASRVGFEFMRDSFIGLILAWHRSPTFATASAGTSSQPAQ